ncbi:biotin/lipoyl-binding protein [Thalassoglobus sp. JC818]|uniref:efflux RND transporter periplasmic adaptor subunit n=1 Tax=Thalassoglobus sp. JC818 TaxID=3232136 RepID=UPI00345A90CF
MSKQTPGQDSLDWIRQQCDRFLDESPTYAAYVRDVFQFVAETPSIDAVAMVAFSKANEPRVVAEANLASVSEDEFFSLDLDNISLMGSSLREGKPKLMMNRVLPEAQLKPHSLAIAPIVVTANPPHVVEVLMLGEATSHDEAFLREVTETLASYFIRYLTNKKDSQEAVTDEAFWQRFDSFLLRLQKSLDLKKTIAVAVNDGRVLTGADRVAIALKYGKQTKVQGISGQDGVQHRANLVQSMAKLAEVAIKIGTPITYKGSIEDFPPELEKPLADYLAESRTRMVMLLPLKEVAESHREDSDADDHASLDSPPVIGCLIIEQATEARPKKHVVDRSDLIRDHIEVAIQNCHSHESIFLLPLWRGIGRTIRWFRGRRLWIAAAILGSVVGLATMLAVVPWDYRVEGTGQAMPVIQHRVFAPWDGDVVEVFVRSGQTVQQGDLLLRIESDELDSERIAARTEWLEKDKLVSALTSQRAEAIKRDDESEFIRITAELAKATVERDGAKNRLDLVTLRIEDLTVTAPDDGVIATFQVDQVLRNRPVRRGDLLVEVMQPNGPWHLEVDVPEYRMGHVMRAFETLDSEELPVEYVLATSVETSHNGVLRSGEIATRSAESEEDGTVFEVFVDIDREDLPNLNIGADVSAKINCGKKSLFYVLFGDVVEFFQRHLWF